MLIDFSSPVSKRLLHTPLIPVPPAAVSHLCPITVSPSNTNPFDKVVQETISLETIENDPFECAIKRTLMNLNTQEKDSFESQKNNQLNETCKINDPVKHLKENVSTEKEKTVDKNEQEYDNKLLVDVKQTNNVIEISEVDKKATMLENKCIAPLICGDDNVSQVSGDLSTEEGIKATIAKRVNKCIQKVLSNSRLQTKKTEVTKNNRKSSSFTTRSSSNNVCDRLNKSCSEPSFINDSFIVVNHDLKSPNSSICSCDVTPSSFLSGEVIFCCHNLHCRLI